MEICEGLMWLVGVGSGVVETEVWGSGRLKVEVMSWLLYGKPQTVDLGVMLQAIWL